jgi:heme/copper-type cytochrome/quinol oxidase subunit 3
MEIPYTVAIRRDTGLTNGKIGIWLFLASEVMLFGALFASYILIRTGAPTWPRGDTMLNVPLATVNTIVLISSSVTMVMAWASLMRGRFETFRIYMGLTILCGLAFLVIKYFEYSAHFHEGALPSTNNFLAIYFTLTGLHGLHVMGGISGVLARSSGRQIRHGSPTASKTQVSSGISWIWSGSFSSRRYTFCKAPFSIGSIHERSRGNTHDRRSRG